MFIKKLFSIIYIILDRYQPWRCLKNNENFFHFWSNSASRIHTKIDVKLFLLLRQIRVSIYNCIPNSEVTHCIISPYLIAIQLEKYRPITIICPNKVMLKAEHFLLNQLQGNLTLYTQCTCNSMKKKFPNVIQISVYYYNFFMHINNVHLIYTLNNGVTIYALNVQDQT